jgi:hypothetical protein
MMTIVAIVSRLMSEDYHSIRVRGTDPLQLWVFDSADRECLLTVCEQTGEISSADYVSAVGKNYKLARSRCLPPPTDPLLRRAS